MVETNYTESTRGEVGQGIYSLAELRTYVAYYADPSDAANVLQWLTGVLNPVGHRSRRPDYSFSDLISLFVVRELLRAGVRPATIRDAEAYMRRRFGVDRPFVSEEVATDGHRVFVRSDEPDQVEVAPHEVRPQPEHRGGQQVQRRVIGPYLHRVRYADGLATAWSPIDEVVLDPRVQFGEPVLEGTRILTSVAAELAEHSDAEATAVRLDVRPSAVRSALKFERRLARLRA